MDKIACAILSVGLCFYNIYRFHEKDEHDWIASLFALIAAIKVIS